MAKKRVLITGMAGFIGHHLAERILRGTDWDVVGLDRLDTSGTLHRLTDIDCWENEKRRVTFLFHDLKAEINPHVASRLGDFDYVFHLAAGTHVDRSISNPMEFVFDNVVATGHLLEWIRTRKEPPKLFYFSTDEVFGPAPEGTAYLEWDRYRSGNPYAATKAGAEELVIAYENTYKIPAVVTHCMNVFGERQAPEKFLPLVINKVLKGEVVKIHSNAMRTKAGSRFYIHARNVAEAVLFLTERGKSGDKYNIVGEKEMDNLAFAKLIAAAVGRELHYELVDFHSSRPGHDLRYALNGGLLHAMGFEFPKTFEETVQKTVRWYLAHPEWLRG